MKTAPSTALRIVKRRASVVTVKVAPVEVAVLRTAKPEDADVIHELIDAHRDKGHLLPRHRDEILIHTDRFVVVVEGDRVIGCGELAPLSQSVAEVRSLVVTENARSKGVGQRIIEELFRRASASGFEKLCAFTHTPGFFTHMGFSIVPHVWLPDKIVKDCHECRHFRHCGQYAVVRSLRKTQSDYIPLAALHG